MRTAPTIFRPHRWVRNPHLQAVLASSRIRLLRHRGSSGLELLRSARPTVLDCGDGARLEARVSMPTGNEAPDLVVMIHGWEGCADSTYLLSMGELLLRSGFAVARLNLRDHGGTQALNEELFHADRVAEVAGAVGALARSVPHRRLIVVGFSLGGNFALRVGLRAHAASLALAHVIAVNPALDPSSTLDAIDGLTLYRRYFVRRWKRSLSLKQAAFPALFDFRGLAGVTTVRGVSELVIPRYTPFETVSDYLASYTLGPDRLSALDVPTTIITAADDPIISVSHFRALPTSKFLSVEIQDRGGHCGYIQGPRLGSWIESRVLCALSA
jgi:predicted alpha/beta-fold hydrolase